MQPDNDPAWNRRRSNRRGEVAMDLEGYVDWTMVSYSLDGLGHDTPLGIAQPSLSGIDQDGNDSISGDETRSLLEVEPDLTLLVRFAASLSDQPSVEIVSARPEVELPSPLPTSGTSVTVTGPSLRMTALVHDVAPQQNRIPMEAFAMLDANADGALDETEIPPQAVDQIPFEQLDADEDGKLTFQEINNRPLSVEPFWTMQVRGRAAEFPDAVFAWLDRDGDWVLSEREILAAGNRLRQGKSESLRANDIPDTFVIQLARGDPSQDDQHFRFAAQPSTTLATVPKWARNMDINQDGDISVKEFVGTIEQFERIDTNGDGFIDQAEVLDVAGSAAKE
jgi:Ca2+-binding EF-hand superfamily protein